MNVPKKWVPPAREFQENSPTPTFKKPLKPPLLLFELFVQSEPRAMLMGPRGCMVGLAAMLPPGIERTSKPSAADVRYWRYSGHGLDFAVRL